MNGIRCSYNKCPFALAWRNNEAFVNNPNFGGVLIGRQYTYVLYANQMATRYKTPKELRGYDDNKTNWIWDIDEPYSFEPPPPKKILSPAQLQARRLRDKAAWEERKKRYEKAPRVQVPARKITNAEESDGAGSLKGEGDKNRRTFKSDCVVEMLRLSCLLPAPPFRNPQLEDQADEQARKTQRMERSGHERGPGLSLSMPPHFSSNFSSAKAARTRSCSSPISSRRMKNTPQFSV
jgi:hypothetical protein